MFDWDLVHDSFSHNLIVVAIDLCAAKQDHPEPAFFLEANYVLCAYDISAPEVLVIVFPIPATIFCCSVIHQVEVVYLKEFFDLPVFSDVASAVMLPVGVVDVTGPSVMSSPFKFVH